MHLLMLKNTVHVKNIHQEINCNLSPEIRVTLSDSVLCLVSRLQKE